MIDLQPAGYAIASPSCSQLLPCIKMRSGEVKKSTAGLLDASWMDKQWSRATFTAWMG